MYLLAPTSTVFSRSSPFLVSNKARDPHVRTSARPASGVRSSLCKVTLKIRVSPEALSLEALSFCLLGAAPCKPTCSIFVSDLLLLNLLLSMPEARSLRRCDVSFVIKQTEADVDLSPSVACPLLCSKAFYSSLFGTLLSSE